MLLRIYASLFITKILKSDFWVALLTFLLALLSQVLLAVAVADWGLGRHGAQLTHEELIYSQLYQWMFGTVSIIATALGKITVILFILQTEHQTKQVRKLFLYFLGVGLLIINIVILGLIWTQCTPTAKMWDNSVVGSCAGRPTEQKVSLFQGSKKSPCCSL